MKQTWRWFGPDDTIEISDLPQAGVQGIVSALHHIAPGDVWSTADINTRKAEIATPATGPTNLTWDVVESLPVSEQIKTRGPLCAAHIAAYCDSLRNIAACGIEVVCYNFMPILDWTRTDLAAPMSHGGTAMKYDVIDFAVFDLFLLKRAAAHTDYNAQTIATATARFDALSAPQRVALQNNIVAGLPGANDTWSVTQVADLLDTYAAIDADQLRANLIHFLQQVVPTAEALGLRLCCHPDDPPFPLLGLPRVMSSLSDYVHVLEAVDSPANGATFCTGSLGVAADFDPVDFITQLGDRIHFAHLRNTTRLAPVDGDKTSFYESQHLEGDTDMVATLKALLVEEARRKAAGRADWEIPMRPDHGQDILHDVGQNSMPGYPLIGRTRALAELRGVIAGLQAG